MIVRISRWTVPKLSTIHLNQKSSENFRPGKTFLSFRRSKVRGNHSIAEIRDEFTCGVQFLDTADGRGRLCRVGDDFWDESFLGHSILMTKNE